MVLSIMLYKVFENPNCVTIQMKATEQYFHVVLFIMLNKAFEKPKLCDHSNEKY